MIKTTSEADAAAINALLSENPRGDGRYRLHTWRWGVTAPDHTERLATDTTVEIQHCWGYLASGRMTAPEDFAIEDKAGATIGHAIVALERAVRERYLEVGARPRSCGSRFGFRRTIGRW